MSILEQILRDKLIPWSDHAGDHIIVAKTKMHASQLPDGVQLKKKPLTGKRVIVKKSRLYHNTRAVSALWQDCGLNEVNLFKIAIVLSGHVDFQLGNQSVLCGPGQFIFIPPNLPHPDGTRNISDTSKSTFCEILYFRLYPNALQCWISRYEPNLPIPRQLGNYLLTDEHVLKLFQVLMEKTTSTSPAQQKLSEKLLQSFFLLLQSEAIAGRYQEVPRGAEHKLHLPDFEQAGEFSEYLHQYIQSHLYDRPTVEKIAQDIYLSRAQFTRRVKAETGKTFVEILNQHRIETAKELLRDSDWTVSSIATFVGYRTPHHFQNLFREKVGMTPNTYRKQSRKFEPKP